MLKMEYAREFQIPSLGRIRQCDVARKIREIDWRALAVAREARRGNQSQGCRPRVISDCCG